ncbi:hypothetical protein ACLQ3B_04880 [Micromonospora sp. DT53]|uniref:hypothetical protein n=1 Tax=Micromonospora sp. DT53 TaxID=3393444 RepID=UPI003CFBB831
MKLDRKTWQLIATAALFLLATVLCIAAWAVANAPQAGPDQLKATDWMQAWGSIAGVAAGLAAAVAATALLMHERRAAEEARRQLADANRAQEESRARSVATAGLDYPRGSLVENIDRSVVKLSKVALHVHNFGPDPIHSIVVTVTLPGGQTAEHNGTEMIGPKDHQSVVITVEPPHLCTGDNPDFEIKMCHVTVSFTDSSGIRWNRTNNGAPERETRPLVTLRDMIEFG